MVWVSVFHSQQISKPSWIGPLGEVWASLAQLTAFLTADSAMDHGDIIAITQWVWVTAEKIAERDAAYDVQPSVRSPQWKLLGFDVADRFLLSGLMNAGYTANEKDALCQQWSSHLNRYHLFDDVAVALQFQALTDRRVQEHSPFSVYGLYLIDSAL
jgi:hypothetical protein